MSGNPPIDQAFNNLTVAGTLTASGRQVSNNIIASNATIGNANIVSATIEDANMVSASIEDGHIENLACDELQISTTNNGLQFDNIQKFMGMGTSPDNLLSVNAQMGVESSSNHRNFMIHNLVTELATAMDFATAQGNLTFTGTSRKVNFNNMTSATIDIYVTVGYPNAQAPTIIPGGGAVAPNASVPWSIPDTTGWNGNFTAFVTGCPVKSGSTLAEFGFNQLWSGATPCKRETFDISTVPPGIGTLCNDGPHGFPPNTQNCVYFSRQSGFNNQQSFGYNIGMKITPPTSMSQMLMSQPVTCIRPDGNCPESIGYPNDTAYPKQQTIDWIDDDYTVDFLGPVVSLSPCGGVPL